MARRFQILRKMGNGELFRTNCDLAELDQIVEEAKPGALWIVVKDRQRRLRQQIWRRAEGTVIPPWWLEE